MKPWTTERAARFFMTLIALFGLLMTAMGLVLAYGSFRGGSRDLFGVVFSAINSMFLVLAAGMALYLRLRGRKGLAIVRGCCVVAVAVSVALGVLFREELGQRGLVLVLEPVSVAAVVWVLVARFERGEGSQVMPAAKRLGKATWREVLLVYLCAAALTALLYAVFGGDHPLFRSRDGWSAGAGREEAGAEVTPPRPADIDVDWGGHGS